MEQAAIQWYEQGLWPLVGAVAVVAISNGVSIFLVYIRAHAELRRQIKSDRLNFIRTQISEFYDPLLTFLAMNRYLFDTLGPKTFMQLPETKRRTAAKIWAEVRERTVLANNRRVLQLLENKTHLLHSSDSLSRYLELLRHIQMYELFNEFSTDMYSRFRFPEGIDDHVNGVRRTLLDELGRKGARHAEQ